jgi:flagellar protein FliL
MHNRVKRVITHISILLLLASSWPAALAGDDDLGPSAYYQELGENFLVNLRPPPKSSFGGFMQTRVEVMVRTAEGVEVIRQHTPYLRNDLIMLFSSKTRDQLLREGGQNNLRRQALSIIRKRIKKESPKTDVAKVLFTQVIIE